MNRVGVGGNFTHPRHHCFYTYSKNEMPFTLTKTRTFTFNEFIGVKDIIKDR